MNRESVLTLARRVAGAAAGGACFVCAFALLAGGCVTVRPEQRATLADPTMQFDEDPRRAAAKQHVLENREGSNGGGTVTGGGCGCN